MNLLTGRKYLTSKNNVVEILFKTDNGLFVGSDVKTNKLSYFTPIGIGIYDNNDDIIREIKLETKWINIYYDVYQHKCVCSTTMFASKLEAEKYITKNGNYLLTTSVEIPETT